MKILCMDWLSKFQCIGGACPLTCCADWRITLTDQEIANYVNMEHPFAKEFVSMIDQENKCMKNKDGFCEALTEDGWCRLVQECGEDCLSATCTFFPRIAKEYGDVEEGTVEIVCPVVAGYLLDSEMVAFEFAEKQMDRSIKEIDYQVYDSLSLTRTYLIELVQEYPGRFVSGKLYIIFKLLNQIRELCGKGELNCESVQKLLQPYDCEEIRKAFLTECEVLGRRYETRGILLQNLLIQLGPIINQWKIFSGLSDWRNNLQQDFGVWISDARQLADDIEKFQQYRNREYPYMTDHFLVYILFLDWITMDLDKFGQHFYTRIIEFTLMQIVAMSEWKHTGTVDRREYEIIIASIDRMVSHQEMFKDKLYHFMEILGNDNIANILMIMI